MDNTTQRKAIISLENPTILPRKTAAGINKGLKKREVLGVLEVGNRITNIDKSKKTLDIKQTKPDKIPTKTTTTTVPQRVTKKASTNVTKPVGAGQITIKREEIIAKQTTVPQVETKCSIKDANENKSYSSQRLDAVEEETVGNDPVFVPEYITDIFSYLSSLELKFPIDNLFLACHKTSPRMRAVLVNWLVEVHLNFKMLPETLHLCVAIIDRYLQKNKSVGRENLQLVGITALLVAAKYEEMYIPDINDFIYVCDDSFNRDELFRMELAIIKALDCNLGRPLSLHFLRRFSKVGKASAQQHTLAKYLLELCLIDVDLCHVRPSLQAAAASYLSYTVFNENSSPRRNWSSTMIHYSTYTYSEIDKTVKIMATAVVKAENSKLQGIRNKYSSPACGKISLCAELKGPAIKKFSQK